MSEPAAKHGAHLQVRHRKWIYQAPGLKHSLLQHHQQQQPNRRVQSRRSLSLHKAASRGQAGNPAMELTPPTRHEPPGLVLQMLKVSKKLRGLLQMALTADLMGSRSCKHCCVRSVWTSSMCLRTLLLVCLGPESASRYKLSAVLMYVMLILVIMA